MGQVFTHRAKCIFPFKSLCPNTDQKMGHQLFPQGGWRGLTPGIFKLPPPSCVGLPLLDWGGLPVPPVSSQESMECVVMDLVMGSRDPATPLLILDATTFQAYPRKSVLRNICLFSFVLLMSHEESEIPSEMILASSSFVPVTPDLFPSPKCTSV